QPWDAGTGRRLGRPWEHPSEVRALAFSPDGRTALSGDAGGEGRGCGVASGKALPRFAQGGGGCAGAFRPRGQPARAGGLDDTARLWDLASGEETLRLRPRPSEAVKAVAFSPDGQTVLTGSWPDARLWDAATGQALGEPLVHHCGVLAGLFGPDGRTVL